MNEYDVFDPYDMDRDEFNPDMCMLRYTKECNLTNMLSRQQHIENEIRDLNCDLQNLLLDNYTKFINASSVVSTMREDFEKMEGETGLLQDKMDAIGETSTAILSNLRPAEKRISYLLRGQETMKKLVSLIELVPTLKQHVESGAHMNAAKHYLKAEPLLKKYKHLTSLDGIVQDCKNVIFAVKSGLFNMLNCDIYTKEELCETLNLLLLLGENPISVASHFLSSSRKYLILHLSSIEDTWMKDQTENKNNKNMSAIVNFVGLCCVHVEKIERIISVMKEIFTYGSGVKYSVDDLLDEFFSQSIDQLSCKLQQRIVEQFQTIDEDFLSQILDKFNRQCHRSGIVTPQINFYEMGMNVIVKICSARCQFHLSRMEDNFNVTMFNIEKEMSPTTNVQKLLNFLIEWTELKLLEVLKSVTYYMRPEFRFCREASFRNAFCKILVLEGIFSSFFRNMNDKIWITMSSKNPKLCNSSLMCLFYAKYLIDLKENIIPKFLIKVNEYLCSCEIRNLSSEADISQILSNTSQKLIEYYTKIRSSNMICMVHKSMENKIWMKCKEPTRPRLVVKMILNELQEIRAETERIFGSNENSRILKDSPRTKEIGNPVLRRTNSIDSLSDQNSIEERILLNKIFKDCSSKRRNVESNIYSILNCILEKTLKSFIEYVRMYTFNCFGLQQIQVDVYVLQSYTSRLLDFSNSSFQALFDEILSSAYNRCSSAEFMNNQVVSVICSESF